MDRVTRRALMLNAVALSGLAAACQRQAAAPAGALGNLDATGVAARIRGGEITALEAMEAAIARAERVNPQLNFLATPLYDAGRARARETLSGPFAGVPTLIKDLMNWTGHPTKYGSRAFADNVSQEQPPYMDAILAAGFAPFGKTTTPEFGLTATTEPMLGGPTRNPWNVEHSCGGSSGGAGAAVAARVVPVAHASDGGGSIRIPASCNGLVGLKPSRGRNVPAGAPDRGIDLSVNGCVSVSVRDTAAWQAAMESTAEGRAFEPIGLVTAPSTRRLGIKIDLNTAMGVAPEADVATATQHVGELCRRLGHTVTEARAPVDGQRFSEDFILLWAAGADEVVELVRRRMSEAEGTPSPIEDMLEPLTLELAQHSRRTGPSALQAAIRRLRQVEGQYASMFADADVYLTPVLAKAPLPLGQINPERGMATFATLNEYVGYTPLQNVAGAPAISLPLGWSTGGLPIGIHFSALAGQERTLLELAYELEQAQPWADRRPAVNAG